MNLFSHKWLPCLVSICCVLQVLFSGLLFSSSMSLRVKEVTENYHTPLEDMGKIKFVFAPDVGDSELPSNQILVLYSPVMGGQITMVEAGVYQVNVVGNFTIYAPFAGWATTQNINEKTICCYHPSGVYCYIYSVGLSGVVTNAWQPIKQGQVLGVAENSCVTFVLTYADQTPIIV